MLKDKPRITNVSLRGCEWLILVETCDLWPIGVQNITTGLNSVLILENFTSVHRRIFVIEIFEREIIVDLFTNSDK
jgi:hypothetical protein